MRLLPIFLLICCGCDSDTFCTPKQSKPDFGVATQPKDKSENTADRIPGDDTREFVSAFKSAQDGCFAKDLRLSKDCWKNTLIQEVTFMTGVWPMEFQDGTAIFRVYPEIELATAAGKFTCIYIKVDNANVSVADFREAFLNADSKLRILEHYTAIPDKDSK